MHNVTDDRRQTDGRTMTYSEREREFTFVKNGSVGHGQMSHQIQMSHIGHMLAVLISWPISQKFVPCLFLSCTDYSTDASKNDRHSLIVLADSA